MSDEQLMITTFTKAYNKYIYDEMVIGQLAHTELKDGVRHGAEVDVIMPAMVNLFDYTGGDLPDAELTNTTTAKVKFDKGKAFHFEVDEVKKQQIANAPDLKQKVELAKEYSYDAIKQFAAAVDTAYGNLYTRAGHYLSGSENSAITLDADYAKEILAYMQAEFKRGDRKGHTNWLTAKWLLLYHRNINFIWVNLMNSNMLNQVIKKSQKVLSDILQVGILWFQTISQELKKLMIKSHIILYSVLKEKLLQVVFLKT